MTTSLDRIKVVLVDDHALVRAGIRQFLEQDERIQVVAETGSGKEACQLVAQNRPDVVVLDIQMPEMSGIEVTRWLREKKYPTGILILTAYDDEPYVRAVIQAGANGYILKTASPADLAEAVQDVHSGKLVLDATLAQKLVRMGSTHEDLAVEELTERELEVLRLTARGFTNKAIALQLHISDRTVQNHLSHIFQKLQAASRTEAVMKAINQGLITPAPAENDL